MYPGCLAGSTVGDCSKEEGIRNIAVSFAWDRVDGQLSGPLRLGVLPQQERGVAIFFFPQRFCFW